MSGKTLTSGREPGTESAVEVSSRIHRDGTRATISGRPVENPTDSFAPAAPSSARPEAWFGDGSSAPKAAAPISANASIAVPAATPGGIAGSAWAQPTIAPTRACPSDWFCYPHLGIAGPIIPYTDCAGSTDIGSAVRRYTCIPGYYLLGHAYTQFGRITGYAIGDQVIVYGRTFTVYGAFTQQSCTGPARPPAPVSLQTSLGFEGCGAVLVVQAR